MRLTRITDQGVQYDVAVDFDERIYLIGDNGTAFVGGDAVRAMDVTNWTAKWTNANFSGNFMAALPNGGLAVHDSGTANLVELDAAGASVQSAALGSFGYQTSFGLWTTTGSGQVSAQVSLPLNEATTSFEFMFGGRTSQRAPRERLFAEREPAALAALDFIYPISAMRQVEYGGLVCARGNRFEWSEMVTQYNQSQVVVPDSQCAPGTLRAHYHTHPPI